MNKSTFHADVALELSELNLLGECSKPVASKALSLAKFDEFETACMSLSDYVDMLISLAKVK